MLVFATSIIRRTDFTKDHGAWTVWDWDNEKEVFQEARTFPKPFCYRNDNERGGARGWKGLVIRDNEIVIANNDCLVFYDLCLNLKSVVTHPSFSGLHSIYEMEGGLLIASTVSDLYARYYDETKELHFFDPMTDPRIEELVRPYLQIRGRTHRKYNPQFDYRPEWREPVVHLNYIRDIGDRTIAFFNSMNMMLEIGPTPKILYAPPLTEKYITDMPLEYAGLNCPHDLTVETEDTVLINSSRAQELYRYNFKKRRLSRIWRGERRMEWTRGLDVIRDGKSALIGTGRGTIVEVDLRTGKTVKEVEVLPPLNGDQSLPHSLFSVVATERSDVLRNFNNM
jgi:hypothetical protein